MIPRDGAQKTLLVKCSTDTTVHTSTLQSSLQQLALYNAFLHGSTFLLKSTPKILSAHDKCFLAASAPPRPPILGPKGYTWPLSEKVLYRFATRASRAKATCSPGCFIFQSDNLGDTGLVWSPPSKNERDHSLLCPVFCKLSSLAARLLGFLTKPKMLCSLMSTLMS